LIMNTALRVGFFSALVLFVGMAVGFFSAKPISEVVADARESDSSAGGGAKPAKSQVDPLPQTPSELTGAVRTLEGILDTKSGRQRMDALEALGGSLARRDLWAAMDISKRLSSLADRKSFLLGVVKQWATVQPAECFNFCLEQDSLALALSLSTAAVETIGAENPQLAAELAQSVAIQGLRENLVQPAARALAAASGPDAAAWASSLGDPLSRELAIREVAGTWAFSEPAAAMAWAANLPDSAMRSAASQSAISSWAEQDLQASLDFVNSTQPGPTRDALVTELSRNIGFHDPVSLMGWISSQPPDVFYPGEMAAVASYMSELDPRTAIARAEQLPQDYKPIALNAVASTWAVNDPRQAMQWIESVSDQRLQAELQYSASAFWAMKDSAQAAAHARTLTDPALRDTALMGVAQALSATNARQALDAAADISNSQSRMDTISGILMDYAPGDTDATRQLLNKSKVSPSDRNALESLLKNQPPELTK
jgi:hypothetical protein